MIPRDAGYVAGDALREQREAGLAHPAFVHHDMPPAVPMPFPWSIGIIAAAIGALVSAAVYELKRLRRARKK